MPREIPKHEREEERDAVRRRRAASCRGEVEGAGGGGGAGRRAGDGDGRDGSFRFAGRPPLWTLHAADLVFFLFVSWVIYLTGADCDFGSF
jgi:hypothetical protein